MTSIASVTRDVPGDKWMAMGPGAKRLAWAYLGIQLDDLLAEHKAVAVTEREELTVVDEKNRRVLMVVEVQTEPEE